MNSTGSTRCCIYMPGLALTWSSTGVAGETASGLTAQGCTLLGSDQETQTLPMSSSAEEQVHLRAERPKCKKLKVPPRYR